LILIILIFLVGFLGLFFCHYIQPIESIMAICYNIHNIADAFKCIFQNKQRLHKYYSRIAFQGQQTNNP
jgi:hypothetical protein